MCKYVSVCDTLQELVCVHAPRCVETEVHVTCTERSGQERESRRDQPQKRECIVTKSYDKLLLAKVEYRVRKNNPSVQETIAGSRIVEDHFKDSVDKLVA